MTKIPANADDAPKLLIELLETDEGVKEFFHQLLLYGGNAEKYVEDLKTKPQGSNYFSNFRKTYRYFQQFP